MGKNQSASNLTNIIKQDASGNITFVSGSTTLMSVSSSGAITTTGNVAGTASYASNAELLDGLDSTVFTLTSSFTAQTASFTAFTSSVNSFTASQNILNGTYATTGSNTFKNPQTINSNLTVTGSITAATLVVQTITSSIVYSSGSNIFGNTSSNTQTFTGSVLVSGSQTISNGDLTISGNRNIYLSNSNPAAGVIRFYNATSGSTKSAIGSYFNIADEGNLEFLTGGTDTRMVITSLGFIGVGVTPSTWGTGSTRRAIEFPGGGNIWAQNFNGNNPSMQVYCNVYESNTGAKYVQSTLASGYYQNVGTHNFSTAPAGTAGAAATLTDRMVITNAGYVLIGTSTSTGAGTTRLQVSGTGTAAQILLTNTNPGHIALYTTGVDAYITKNTGGGTMYFGLAPQDGSTFTSHFQISSSGAASLSSTLSVGNALTVGYYFTATAGFNSYTGDGLFNAASRYCAINTPGAADRIRFGYNDYGGGQYYGRIGFAAPTNWSLGIITGAGNDFSIGTGYQGQQFYIYANGNYDFTGSDVSDRRKKTNINYITTNQLDNILKLKPVTFNKIAGETIGENIHTGFIAQDILELGIPNLVMGSDEGGYGLDYNGILSLAVKAIQELKAEIDELKNR